MSELSSMCPHCGELVGVGDDTLTKTHDWPLPTRQVCPGSGQIPRNAKSDGRSLWNGKPNRYFYRNEPTSGCEYMVSMAEGNAEMCDRVPTGFVGVDHSPYCDLHIEEMRAREEAST